MSAGPRRPLVPAAGAAWRACQDEVRVICGVARVHRGLEAREVQGEARVAAVQLLRLVEKLFLEGLRRLQEADAVGADLGEEAELGRPEDIRLTPFNLAFSMRNRAPYAASRQPCKRGPPPRRCPL